ncbi:MAG: hypothetical protein CVU12_02050 [Bacteroidetes bacterium HGW-Bacteroidetes-7]|jgi:hypothetical protein|nr:MAG: hypothetical protein CVU12_02050 [Bacteroidetes bacterium HGW-Bacteroidetes-7]
MRTIKIAETQYPVRITMGAMREFRKLSGKEVEEISGSSDVGEFLYSCALSTCRAEAIAFDLTVEDFTDSLDFVHANEVFTLLLSEAGYMTETTEAANKKKGKKKGS